LEPDPGNSGVGKRSILNKISKSPPLNKEAVFLLLKETRMQITINGETRQVSEGSTVRQLLDELQITATRVAVEVNLAIVPKAGYAEHTLQDGDAIEIVHFVGGG
jgi:sulfur carrier protein